LVRKPYEFIGGWDGWSENPVNLQVVDGAPTAAAATALSLSAPGECVGPPSSEADGLGGLRPCAATGMLQTTLTRRVQ